MGNGLTVWKSSYVVGPLTNYGVVVFFGCADPGLQLVQSSEVEQIRGSGESVFTRTSVSSLLLSL